MILTLRSLVGGRLVVFYPRAEGYGVNLPRLVGLPGLMGGISFRLPAVPARACGALHAGNQKDVMNRGAAATCAGLIKIYAKPGLF